MARRAGRAFCDALDLPVAQSERVSLLRLSGVDRADVAAPPRPGRPETSVPG